MSSPKNICLNCGKNGHQVKFCSEPIVSYGLVCYNFDAKLNLDQDLIKNFFYNKFIDINEFNYANLSNIRLIPEFYDKIKILMIMRKHSLNYVEFVRGKYDIDDKKDLNRIFNLMSKEENIKIRTENFDTLWSDLWKDTAKSKVYQKEYNIAKTKFTDLKSQNFYNLLSDDNLSEYDEPEWGFPKGRRNPYETNLSCAIREFSEETNLDTDDLHIFERLSCLEEEYEGTNLIKYKHIYWIASSENEINLKIDNQEQNKEVGDIRWFTIPEALKVIRPYSKSKLNLVHQLYFFLINLVTNINCDNNSNYLSI